MVCFSVHYEHEISNVNRIIRDFNKGNYDPMKDILAHTDWDSLMEGSGPYPGIDPGWVYSFTPTATA